MNGDVDVVGGMLAEAEASGEPVAAPALAGLDMAAAYAVQRAFVERLAERHGPPVGWKVGMASALRPPGAPGPIYGRLLAGMVVPEGTPIDVGGLRRPEAEGEIAFVLGRDLCGPGVGVAEALAATRGVMPAIEVIAGRLEAAEHTTEAGVADNAASSLAVLGGVLTAVEGLDLRLLGLVLTRGGRIVATGAGAAVLGHPAHAVAWLANALAGHGGLRAGEVVLSGSISGAFAVAAGDTVRADVDRLGSVTATFA